MIGTPIRFEFVFGEINQTKAIWEARLGSLHRSPAEEAPRRCATMGGTWTSQTSARITPGTFTDRSLKERQRRPLILSTCLRKDTGCISPAGEVWGERTPSAVAMLYGTDPRAGKRSCLLRRVGRPVRRAMENRRRKRETHSVPLISNGGAPGAPDQDERWRQRIR